LLANRDSLWPSGITSSALQDFFKHCIASFGINDSYAALEKLKSGQLLRSKQRQIVLSVFNYMKNKNPEKGIGWTANEHVQATDISIASVLKIRAEAARSPLVLPKKKRERK
jgi:hypothetical protein